MKKAISILMAALLCVSVFAACGETESSSSESSTSTSTSTSSSETSSEASEESSEAESSEESTEGGAASGPITVVSREDGSGTRGAFVELIGVEDEEGNDMTTVDAEISNSTEVVIQSVAGNTGAIGYISLGSLDDTVKGVKIDGVEPTAENIENGSYTVSRPFNVATKGELTNEAAQDFMNYIMSEEGQAIVAEDYIPVADVEAFESNGASGSVTISGSSSVSPLMQKLIEGYNAVNPNVEIELQTSDSTTGMTDAINGMSDIGMASRELKQEELDAGLVNTVIATDGIAIIVNNESPIEDLTTEQVKEIYLGNVTDWSEVA
ncbi:MAG TPA: substrate-binding domain-containing protein [Candidatus Acutalibacter pullistercoris]|uniref:Substrate-binding domain-containing protein n=1 Tax=Candidatus Acutalibacter pullistercoris TaxID=2838418 RepID=A0A9D2BZQ2_9FIRM|nr:substrate-binding domain-containing protein [Candidatus Acutalibacter pullistercoris]